MLFIPYFSDVALNGWEDVEHFFVGKIIVKVSVYVDRQALNLLIVKILYNRIDGRR